MEKSNMKNMLVLKNLPSNIVEEAIIVLKENMKVKKFETIHDINNENNSNVKENTSKKDNDYIVKEAEMIVSKYISNIENNEKNKKSEKILQDKYKALKKYSIFITIMFLIAGFVNML